MRARNIPTATLAQLSGDNNLKKNRKKKKKNEEEKIKSKRKFILRKQCELSTIFYLPLHAKRPLLVRVLTIFRTYCIYSMMEFDCPHH
jgi:hypothetical protein